MIVSVLAENTSASSELRAEHGLSLHIETRGHRVLFDTGASGLFAENAEKMGIDLSAIDTAVISHGHYDHGGGLRTFLGLNSRAKVHFRQGAFEPHYADRPDGEKAYIGLDRSLLPNDRFVFDGERSAIGEGLELFSGVKGTRYVPSGNRHLLVSRDGSLMPDDFAHEQNLMIDEGGKMLLVAGCSHAGIVNILERFERLRGRMPDALIGGFHMYKGACQGPEDARVVKEVGKILAATGVKFRTCHCTGQASYDALREVMGENIDRLSTDRVLKLFDEEEMR